MAELDQPGFTRDTRPNLYHSPSFGEDYQAARSAYVAPAKELYPARDNRYPAYAGPLEDARLVTDYRPQCTKNIRPALQFSTKAWLINHATEIMEEARQRQIEWSGASLPMANTVPPPAAIVHSTPFYSEVNHTYMKNGLGVERANAKAPPLFGTYEYEPTMQEMRMNRKNIALTTHREGGRNSTRGKF
jgi:hypothetical protein